MVGGIVSFGLPTRLTSILSPELQTISVSLGGLLVLTGVLPHIQDLLSEQRSVSPRRLQAHQVKLPKETAE